MAKLEITAEVADDNILGKIAKVEEARRNLNNAWADLQNCFTAKYGTAYENPAEVKEKPTACNVDKIVAELEASKEGLTAWPEDAAYAMGIDKAIRLIKGEQNGNFDIL